MRKPTIRKSLLIAGSLLALILGFVGYQAYRHYVWAGETEEVSFESDEIRIAGLFVKPKGNAPYPAVVFLHGSGRADGNHELGRLSRPCQRHVAEGASRSWRTTSVVVVRRKGTLTRRPTSTLFRTRLRQFGSSRGREDVDADQIGLLGTSEGGWLTPEVATVAGDISFIVNKCGPPISCQETFLFEMENDLRAEGVC